MATQNFRVKNGLEVGIGATILIAKETGNVGVNTTAPEETLTVYKEGVAALFRGDNYSITALTSTPRLRFGTDTSYAGYMELGAYNNINNLDTKARDFNLFSSSVDPILHVKNDTGNIGIGTDNPEAKLHISSGTSGDCELILEADTDNNNEIDNPRILFRQDGGNDWSVIGNGVNNSTANNALVLANSVANYGGIIFQTNNNDTGYSVATERMRITSAGNIGIGTDDPTAKLDVRGTLSVSGITTITNDLELTRGSNTSALTRKLVIGGARNLGSDFATLQFKNYDSNNSAVDYVAAEIKGSVPDAANDGGELVFLTAADGATSQTERVRITSAGDVGIGTDNPGSNARLHIVDDGNVGGIVLGNAQNAETARIDANWNSLQIAADQYIYLKPANTTVVTLNPSGNVGIGTDNPSVKLDVYGGSAFVRNIGGSSAIEVGSGQNSNQYAYLDLIGDTTYTDYGLRLIRNNTGANANSELVHRGTGTLYLTSQDAGSIALRTQSLERVVINSAGDVGIGTASPEYNLDLGQLSSSTIRLVSENNGTAIRVGAGGESNDVTLLRVDGTSSGARYRGESNVGGLGFSIKYMGSRTGNNNSLSIFGDNGVSDGAGSQVEAVTVLQDGKIGIGTDNPGYKLEVAGDIKLADNGTLWFDDTSGTIEKITATNATIDYYADGSHRFYESDGNVQRATFDVNQSSGRLYFDGDTDTYFTRVATDCHVFVNAGSESLRINASGDVGINSTTPTQTLDVNGNVAIGGSVYDNNNQPGTDGQILSNVVGFGVSWINVGSVTAGNADLLDNLDSTQFLRSDAADTKTGITTFQDDATFQSNVYLGDNDVLNFGDDNDLQIYHDGSNSYIVEGGTGGLRVGSSRFQVKNPGDSKLSIDAFPAGEVALYYDNSKKFETTGIGVSIVNGTSDTATIYGPSNLIIDPMPVGVGTTSGIVRIKGDLYVDGTTTQINSTTIELADFIVGIATTATTDLLADGAGIGIGTNKTFLYEYNSGTNPSLKSSENLNVASGKVYQIDQTERLSANTLSLGTGTTIHSPASNVLSLGINGKSNIRVENTGDVTLNLSTTYDDEGILKFGRQDGVGRDHFIRVFNTGTPSGNYMKFDVHDGSLSSGGLADATTVMTLLGDGKVGIGSENPSVGLELGLTKGDNQIKLKSSDGNVDMRINPAFGNADVASVTVVGAYPLTFHTSNTERIRIESGGNVGIGTDNPDSKLTVAANSASARIEIKRTNANSSGSIGAINFTALDGHSVSNISALADGDDEGAHLIFKTTSAAGENNPYGSNTFERLRITSTGNVGIATNNPSQTLDVNGNARFRGAIYDNNNVVGVANSILTSTGSGVVWADITSIPVGDASTLDNLDSTQFLRSDVADTKVGVTTFQDNVHLLDDDELLIGGSAGTHDGLKIYHSTSGTEASYIQDTGTGVLYIDGYSSINLRRYSNQDSLASFNAGGSVDLYHNAVKKFETTGFGVTVSGGLNVSGVSTFQNNIIASSTLTVGDAAPSGGAPTDQGVLAVYGTGRNALIIQTDDNTLSRGLAFRNSGDKYAAYISAEDIGSNKVDLTFGVAPDTSSTYTDVDNVDERVRITSGGDVGIGTTNPSNKLHVQFSGDDGLLVKSEDSHASVFIDSGSGSGSYLRFLDNGSNTYWIHENSGHLDFRPSAGTAQARFSSDGKFVVGSTATVARFTVDDSTGDAPCVLLPDTSNSRYAVGFGNVHVTGVGQRLDFYAGDSGSNGTNLDSTHRRMSLTADGKLGIGTDNPSQTLDVDGNARFRDRIYDSGNSAGTNNQVLTSGGASGVWTWKSVTALGSANVNVLEETTTLGSFTDLSFVSGNLTATGTGSTATITLTDSPTFTNLKVTGITTIPNVSGVTTFANDAYFDSNVYLGDQDRLRFGNPTDPDLEIYHTGNDSYIQETGQGNLYIDSSTHIFRSGLGTEYARITSAGDVGIGTDNPQGKLHISSGTSGDCELILEADTDNAGSETDNPTILFRQDGGSDWSAIGNGVNDSSVNNALVLANSVSSGGGIIFQTNTGAGYTNATERMRIASSGDIGIGINSPTVKLDVYDDTSGSGATAGTTLLNLRNHVGSDLNQQKTFIDFIFTDSNNNETPQVRIGAEVGENGDANSEILEGSGAFVVYTNDSDTTSGAAGASLAERFRVDYAGNVGINSTAPTEKLDVVGTVKATDFNTTSDQNLKTNIQTIEDPLEKIVQIRGVNFEWKENNKPSAGVIAQEVEKVLPQLVTDSGTKTVNYNGLIGLLIEAVKAQQEEINMLKERLK